MDDLAAQISRFRRDTLFGRETVFAGSRKDRPRQTDAYAHEGAWRECPFCPGNERLLADIVWQLDRGDTWRTRTVMNLYPIVAPPTGRHEVIIDAPEHRLSSVDMTLENWQDLLATYGARYHALGADWPHVSLYRNAGRKAGASIEHPHSQIIAMARQPAAVKSVHARLQRAFRESGRCLLCDQLRRAAEDGGRLVAESSDFAVLAPEVPEVSFEVWVVPRAHGSVFARNDAEIAALARSLHDLLYRMNRVLGDFDYNMMLQCDGPGDHPHLHWFMRLRPKLETGGGFEMATGISVNATQPESDATALRAAGRSQP